MLGSASVMGFLRWFPIASIGDAMGVAGHTIQAMS
jgi:hypothetical protein